MIFTHGMAIVIGLAVQAAAAGPPATAPGNGLEAAAQIRALAVRAEQGDTRAEVELGLDYASGTGVDEDDAKALAFFLKAAAKHDAQAEYALGEMYLTGRGVEKSPESALKWMHLAAEHGEAHAQYNLAALYFSGQGVPKNDVLAASLMRKAAEQNFSDGQFGLGTFYENGTGVQKSDADAAAWYRKAASQGNADAANNLALLLATTSDTAVRNPEQAVAIAQRVAEHTPDNPDAFDTLALVYSAIGKPAEAAAAEEKAAALKPADAHYKEMVAKYQAASQGK